jgi:diketogulonate reductase-like aldo/keto reductase
MYNELVIPSIGLGTLRLCADNCVSIIKKALELGYRHIEKLSKMFVTRDTFRCALLIKYPSSSTVSITSDACPIQVQGHSLMKGCDTI